MEISAIIVINIIERRWISMNKKHDIEVIIQNKRYTLCGYESEEYLQKIASYINARYAEFKENTAYRLIDHEIKNILVQINIADDYFKAREKADELKSMSDQKSEEIYDIKHEVIAVQTRLNEAQQEIKRLEQELSEANKKIIQLESRHRR